MSSRGKRYWLNYLCLLFRYSSTRLCYVMLCNLIYIFYLFGLYTTLYYIPGDGGRQGPITILVLLLEDVDDDAVVIVVAVGIII